MRTESTGVKRGGMAAIYEGVMAVLLCAVLAFPAGAMGTKHTAAPTAAKATPPEEALRNYITRVRAQQAAEVRTPGSIWSPEGQMVRLGTDVKAFRIHDVVMIEVGESLTASTDGQVKNSRASSANSGITSLFGAHQGVECIAESRRRERRRRA